MRAQLAPTADHLADGVGQAVLRSAHIAFVAVDADGLLVAWNPGAEATFGWPAHEVLGRSLADVLVPERLRAAHRAGLARHRDGAAPRVLGTSLEMPALHRDGRELIVELTIEESGVAAAGGPTYHAVLRDITRQRRDEAELRRMADVVRTSRDALMTVDRDGIVQTANPAFEELMGYPEATVVGHPLDGHRNQDLAGPGRACRAAIAAGVPVFDMAAQLPRACGGLLDIEVSAIPLTDADGELIGATLVVRDVTERRDEERRLEDQLSRLQSLSAAEPGAGPQPGPESGSAGPIVKILQAAREHLALDVAWLAQMRDGELEIAAVQGDTDVMPVEPGCAAGDYGGYCRLMLDERIPHHVPDTSAEAELADLRATREGLRSYAGVPVVLSDGTVHGALCAASLDPAEHLSEHHVRFLTVLARIAADSVEHADLRERQRAAEAELDAVRALLAALDARDHYTGDHSRSVVELAVAVAGELGLDAAAVADAERVALLHDIGKVGIPDTILQKRGPLTDREWELMREHPAIGERIVASIPSLAHLAPAIRAEHERVDGGGYPDGLDAGDIPIASRIALACDAWHAMRSDRPYRRALPHDAAVAELRRGAGSQFDSGVVEALLGVLTGAPG